jgi:hypothetical protein
MRRLGIGILAVAGGIGLAQLPAAAQPSTTTAWLHVRVEETRGSKVNVNLPLPVVEAAIKAAPESVFSDDKFHLGLKNRSLKVSDIRRMWLELKKSGDVDLVTVEDQDEHVNVAKKGDLLLVHVKKAGRDQVQVEIPADVVDALFDAPGDELNVRAALVKLQARRGDIVRVNDNDNTVRVWIDEK